MYKSGSRSSNDSPRSYTDYVICFCTRKNMPPTPTNTIQTKSRMAHTSSTHLLSKTKRWRAISSCLQKPSTIGSKKDIGYITTFRAQLEPYPINSIERWELKWEHGPYANESNLYTFFSSSSIYLGSASRDFHLTQALAGFGNTIGVFHLVYLV